MLSDCLFHKVLDAELIPGGELAMLRRGSALLKKAYSNSNEEDEKLVDFDNTLFQIGSVCKIFTVVAAIKLVEKGMLDLSLKVNKYLKDFKIENPSNTPITLYNLLTNSAGFNDRIIAIFLAFEFPKY